MGVQLEDLRDLLGNFGVGGARAAHILGRDWTAILGNVLRAAIGKEQGQLLPR
jgi:hypothetical protein